MLYNTLHNRALRLGLAVAGELITAAGINLFIVPLGLYSGGTLGVCQLIRTFLQSQLGLDFGTYDIAGALYLNHQHPPILIFAWRVLGRGLAVRTIVCTAAYSVFASLIPVPAQPIVGDYLTACILGGILTAWAAASSSPAGAAAADWTRWVCAWASWAGTSPWGRFSILFNAVLYTICPDRLQSRGGHLLGGIQLPHQHRPGSMHQQNVTVQALIFTREDESVLATSSSSRWAAASPTGTAWAPTPRTMSTCCAYACPNTRSRSCCTWSTPQIPTPL